MSVRDVEQERLIKRIAAGCGIRHGEHRRAAAFWASVGTSLAIIAAVASSAAGASLLSNVSEGTAWWYVAGFLGVVGGAGAALIARLDPSGRAARHRHAAATFSSFRTSYNTLASKDLTPGEDGRARPPQR